MRGFCLVVFVAIAGVTTACAAPAPDKPFYGPPAAWIKPIPIPPPPKADGGLAIQTLLTNSQVRMGADGQDFYTENALRVMKPEALAVAGGVALSWNPETETLTVHHLRILRDGKVIDLLAGGKTFTVLRREENLDLSVLTGRLTATLQPEGLRVGDILTIATTLHRQDPVYQGHVEAIEAISSYVTVGRLYFRALWPVGKDVSSRTTVGMPPPRMTTIGGQHEAVIDATDVRAPKAPNNAPGRFRQIARWEMSDFSGWDQVSSLMAPLYEKAARLEANSPLRAEVARIKSASNDPKARATLALKLVQEQTRYVFLGMNLGGFKPAAADLTWSRRFGDCKGKTALLLVLLHELGVQAEPALVNSVNGDGLDERRPILANFDHVLVRAVIAGRTYWLDGTRTGDVELGDIRPPAFTWALPVRARGAQLERIVEPPLAEPDYDLTFGLDASAGLDKPAKASIVLTQRGDMAFERNLMLTAQGAADADRSLREEWTKTYPWIDATGVAFAYDPANHILKQTLSGLAKMQWARNGGFRDFDIAESNLAFKAAFKREPGPNQDAPYAVEHPRFSVWHVRITLPAGGAGFQLVGAPDADTIIAGVDYKRRSRLTNGVVDMAASERSLGADFPFKEAEAAEKALEALHRLNVYVRTADLGDESESDKPPEAALPAPVSAADYSRRGVVFFMHHDFAKAIADFSEAIRSEPKTPKHYYNRGLAHLRDGQAKAALTDFDTALSLNPRDGLALAGRATARLSEHDETGAKSDLDTAISLAPDSVEPLQRAAKVYIGAGQYGRALDYLDPAIRRFPKSPAQFDLLLARSEARTWLGRDLTSALADGQAAVLLQPTSADAQIAVATARLRSGAFAEAITEFQAAIALDKDNAVALYGRGLARGKVGQKALADADISAAKAIDPQVDGYFSWP